MDFLFLFCLEVELRAVFGGSADSHGYRMQSPWAVSAGGSGAAAHIGCAGGWRWLCAHTAVS